MKVITDWDAGNSYRRRPETFTPQTTQNVQVYARYAAVQVTIRTVPGGVIAFQANKPEGHDEVGQVTLNAATTYQLDVSREGNSHAEAWLTIN